MDEKQLVDYACLRFEEEKYDEALEAFVLAYSKGYEREWIIENIYACYMAGNEPAFREAYEKQGFASGVSYEACTLDFIPYKDGEYYVFDKACAEFRGKFVAAELANIEPLEGLKIAEFSAAAIEFDGEWSQHQDLLAEATNRKIYAICHDMKRGMSYWKIPELEKYLANVRMFPDRGSMQQYFHENTAVYLPKIVYGENQGLSDLFDQEHAYRLTPEGRNTENVLLTIGIPTANRGNLVLDRLQNLLRMQYDAEIEIVVSKNCMELFQEEYDKIAQIMDARLLYHDHGKALAPRVNWHSAVEMAHGKYVTFVSDEDDIVLEQLEHYLKLLSDHPEVSVLRAKSMFQGQSIVKRDYGKMGIEAFKASFLHQNYLSGLTFRREDFLKADLLRYEAYTENFFYRNYPHEWWCAALCRTGAYLEEPVALIIEKDDVLKEESKKLVDMGARAKGYGIAEDVSLPGYSTYESRLKQFRGQAEFLHVYMQDDLQGAEVGLNISINKTCFLFRLARCYHYKPEQFMDFVDEYAQVTMDIIDEFGFGEEQQRRLLQLLQNDIVYLYSEHQKLLETEKKENQDEAI